MPPVHPVDPAGTRGGWLVWRHPAHISRTRNMLWNAAFNVVQGLLPLAFIPVYLRLVGPEAYSLVVLNGTVLTAVMFLDRLLAPTIIREFGRKNGDESAAAAMGQLLRSFLGLAAALGVLVCIGTVLALPFLFEGWAQQSSLTRPQMQQASLLMGLSIGVQWPGFLSMAALAGLQRQELSSGLRVAGACFQHLGGVAVLLLAGPDILHLLAWQVFAFFITSLLLWRITWAVMPPAPDQAHFRMSIPGDIWRMAVGSLLVGAAAALISHADKFMVARLARPEAFTAYGLSFLAAGALFHVVTGPLGAAMQPHFARLIAQGDEALLAQTYHRWAQVFAILLLPSGGFLMGFAGPAVELWLGAGPTAAEVRALLPPAALGLLLLALLTPPTLLQIAAGWNGLLLFCYLTVFLAILLAMPPVLLAAGPTGAAWLMAALWGLTLPVMGAWMDRRVLRGAFWRWLIRDVGLPLAATALIFAISHRLLPDNAGGLHELGQGLVTAMASFGLLMVLLADGRTQLLDAARHLVGRTRRIQ